MEYVQSMISVILVTDDETVNLNQAVKAFRDQAYKNVELIIADGAKSDQNYIVWQALTNDKIAVNYVCDKEHGSAAAVNQALELVKGNLVHICDAKTTFADNNAYIQVVDILKESDADVGCFGWFRSDKAETENLVKNGFCGTGTGYALLRDALQPFGKDGDYTSYGNMMFNKVFRKKSKNGSRLWKEGFYSDLYDLCGCDFIIQMAAVCGKVVFSSEPLFRHPSDVSHTNIKDIEVGKLFPAISRMIAEVEKCEPRHLSQASWRGLEYELCLSSEARSRNWNSFADRIDEHIKAYYSNMISMEQMLNYAVKKAAEVTILDRRSDELKKNREKLYLEFIALGKKNNELWKKNQNLERRNGELCESKQKLSAEMKELSRKSAELQRNKEKLEKQIFSLNVQIKKMRRDLDGTVVRWAVRVQNLLRRGKKMLKRK